jgi:hypothetical protein
MTDEIFENWRKEFYSYLEKEHPDLSGLYDDRIYVVPVEGGYDMGVNAVDAIYIGEEKKKRMVDVFTNYAKDTHCN